MSDPLPITAAPTFQNCPLLNFALEAERDSMTVALRDVVTRFGQYYPLIIAGQEVRPSSKPTIGEEYDEHWIRSSNPSRPWETVGWAAKATKAQADAAMQAAHQAFGTWSKTSVEERADALMRTADYMLFKRYEYAAWAVYEAGKPWREADGDVAEAVDFLRYYAEEMRGLGAPRLLQPMAGETNLYEYRPVGPGVVIAPWNFPIAILTGMVAAAVVAGNSVVMKPAEQTPVCAWWVYQALTQGGGLPAGVVNYLPGIGDEIGPVLVGHHLTSYVAFTGSVPVGLKINELAARVNAEKTMVTRVVAEMGGKNAIIVDTSADVDSAVNGVVRSAYYYAGQKCSAASRVIVLEPVYEVFLKRLREATESLIVGPADDPATQVGPVIDQESVERITSFGGDKLPNSEHPAGRGGPGASYYIRPTIVERNDVEDRVCQEEVFGPVVVVLKARTFGEALRLANSTRFALTGGIYSRTPSHIDQVRSELECGNLYINRPITGAIVGRQPFGGYKMSGIGSKAGGPDYLKQFLIPRTITENTLRHGFAPSVAGEGE